MILAPFLLLVFFFSLFPGYLLASYYFHREGDPPELMAAVSFGLSLVMIAAISLLSWAINTPPGVTHLFFYLLLCLAIIKKTGTPKIEWPAPLVRFMLAFLCLVFFMLGVMSILPSYQAGYIVDWSHYFRNVFFYLNQVGLDFYRTSTEKEMLFRRTPYFSLINAFFLSWIKPVYYYFQVISLFLGSLLFLPVAGLTRIFSSRGKFPSALLMFVFCPIFFFNVCQTIPKPLATFFLLTFYLIYLHDRRSEQKDGTVPRYTMALVFGGAAILTHPSMLFYAAPVFLNQIIHVRKRKEPDRWRDLSLGWGIIGIQVGIWWLVKINLIGWRQAFLPAGAIRNYAMPMGLYLWSRITMVAACLVAPVELVDLLRAPQGIPLFDWADAVLRFYWETFLGGFTIAGSLLFLATLVRKSRGPVLFGRISILWAAIGGVCCILAATIVNNEGQSANILMPLTAITFSYLVSRTEIYPQKFQRLSFLLAAPEFIFAVFVLYTSTLSDSKLFPYLFLIDASVTPTRAIPLTIFLVCFLSGFIYFVGTPKTNQPG